MIDASRDEKMRHYRKKRHISKNVRTCSCISMKEKLAEKRAKIARKDAKSHEEESKKKLFGIGLED